MSFVSNSRKRKTEVNSTTVKNSSKRQKVDSSLINDTPKQDTDDTNDAENEELMKLIDEAPEIPHLDGNGLRKLMHDLHECLLTNKKQRSKFATDASKFVQSELALFNALQQLCLQLPSNPHLFSEFVSNNGIANVLDLLQHENIDIVAVVIGLMVEMTEADNYALLDTNADNNNAIALPLKFIAENGVGILLENNIKRLNDPNIKKPAFAVNSNSNVDGKEELEDDSQTIFAILNILENLSEIDTDFCAEIISKCKFFRILLSMMRKKQEFGEKLDEIQLYCSEIISIYLQAMDEETIFARFAEIRGVDKLLDLLMDKYLKQDPMFSEEREYVSNLLDSLMTSLVSVQNQRQMEKSSTAWPNLLSLIKAKNFTKEGAIKVLNYAITDSKGNCEKCIENGGLKTVFAALMKKKIDHKYKHFHSQQVIEEHLVCIIVQLFCNSCDVPLLRVRQKFVEKEFEKIDRFIELYVECFTCMEDNDMREKKLRVENGLTEETLAERYARRLDEGFLFTVQMISIGIAFVYTWDASLHGSGDDDDAVQQRMRERIEQVLNQSDMDIENIQQILMEYCIVVGDDIGLGRIACNLLQLMSN